MMETPSALAFRWVGGHAALDFANTVAWSVSPRDGTALPRYERLTSYDRLVEWSRSARQIDGKAAASLLEHARRSPSGAEGALEHAKALREAIHRLFTALARNEPAPAGALAVLNDVYRDGCSRRAIVEVAGGFALGWRGADASLEAPLWPLTFAAAELLTSAAVTHLRQCAGDSCGFLFLDTSRGHRRRWCDMADCGNLAKVRRHRHRERNRVRSATQGLTQAPSLH